MNRREFFKKSLEGIIVGIPLISGCGKNPLGPNEGIEYYMQTNKKEYELGENVEMLYRVTNRRGGDVTFNSNRYTMEPPCVFRIMDNDIVVWSNTPPGVVDIDVNESFTLQPNDNKEFYYDWNVEGVNPKVYDVTSNLNFFIHLLEFHKYVPVSVPIKIIQ